VNFRKGVFFSKCCAADVTAWDDETIIIAGVPRSDLGVLPVSWLIDYMTSLVIIHPWHASLLAQILTTEMR